MVLDGGVTVLQASGWYLNRLECVSVQMRTHAVADMTLEYIGVDWMRAQALPVGHAVASCPLQSVPVPPQAMEGGPRGEGRPSEGKYAN
jgi:hypothetical protein